MGLFWKNNFEKTGLPDGRYRNGFSLISFARNNRFQCLICRRNRLTNTCFIMSKPPPRVKFLTHFFSKNCFVSVWHKTLKLVVTDNKCRNKVAQYHFFTIWGMTDKKIPLTGIFHWNFKKMSDFGDSIDLRRLTLVSLFDFFIEHF